MANKKNFLTALKKLELLLGIAFPSLPKTIKAFEHPSIFCKTNRKKSPSYFQRLEFLGDRVLSLVLTDYIYNTYTSASEGELAKRLTFLIRTETLASIAKELDLFSCLNTQTDAFNTLDSTPESILADTTEVLIGHIFETFGYKVSSSVILKVWAPYLKKVGLKTENQLKDAKSRLQEIILKKGTELPVYKSTRISGEDHKPVFETTLTLPCNTIYKSTGASKAKAEQSVAATAISSLSPSCNFKNKR